MYSAAISELTHFRPSGFHSIPMAHYNGSLNCVIKSTSEQIVQITESVANRSIDRFHECSAFNLVHLERDHSPLNTNQSSNCTPKSHS